MIINFDDIIGKKFNTIINNVFCLSHPKNSVIFIYFDKIDKKHVNLIIFDDLIFSNKEYLNFIVEVEN